MIPAAINASDASQSKQIDALAEQTTKQLNAINGKIDKEAEVNKKYRSHVNKRLNDLIHRLPNHLVTQEEYREKEGPYIVEEVSSLKSAASCQTTSATA